MTRIVHPRDGRMRIQERGHPLGPLTMSLHSNCESLQSAEQKPRVHWSWDGADCVLQKAEPLGQLSVAGGDGPHDQVRVAAEILGRRVHHRVGAEVEWALQIRGCKGVVHHHQGTRLVPERVTARRDPTP